MNRNKLERVGGEETGSWLRSRLLTRQMSFLENNLESASLSHRGVSAASLALERLEKQLEKEKNEKEFIAKELAEATGKYEKILEAYHQIKRETEESISSLQVKCQKLQEKQDVREAQTLKLIEKIEQRDNLQAQFQKKQSEELEKLLCENKRLGKIQIILEEGFSLLQEKFQKEFSALAATISQQSHPALAAPNQGAAPETQTTATESSETAPATKEPKEASILNNEIVAPPVLLSHPTGFLKHCLEWWSEPVMILSSSSILFLKKSDPV